MRKLFLIIMALPVLIMSCQQEGKSVEAMTEEEEKNAAIRSVYDGDENYDTTNIAAFEFEEKTIDFDTIKQGEKINFEFKFKNVGKVPLMIADTKVTCGCTVPNPPKEPIPVGESSSIKGSFNSAGKTGNQVKTITIVANTYPRETRVKITGFVDTEEDK